MNAGCCSGVNKLAHTALVVAVAGLILIAAVVFTVPYLVWSWGYTDEEWPEGQAVKVRTAAEEVAFPPVEAEFVNVHRYGGGWDIPYRECVYYRTDMSLANVLEHYTDVLQMGGFQKWGPRPDYAGENYFTVRSNSTASPAGLSIDFGGPTPHHKKPHSYAVCSVSFERVAEAIANR